MKPLGWKSRPTWVLVCVLIVGCISTTGGAVVRAILVAQEAGPYLSGQLLVATPEMPDPRFAHTVILLTRHDEQGAMGLIVNRPMAKGPLSTFLKAVGIENEIGKDDVTLHYGGPVRPEKIFVLHTDDYVNNTTDVVAEGLGVTTNKDVIRAIARSDGPRQSLVILGCAGWGPGQLEAEIRGGAWFLLPADKGLIFSEAPEKAWQRALDRRKVKT
jgi:putative transcriptional regulator